MESSGHGVTRESFRGRTPFPHCTEGHLIGWVRMQLVWTPGSLLPEDNNSGGKSNLTKVSPLLRHSISFRKHRSHTKANISVAT